MPKFQSNATMLVTASYPLPHGAKIGAPRNALLMLHFGERVTVAPSSLALSGIVDRVTVTNARGVTASVERTDVITDAMERALPAGIFSSPRHRLLFDLSYAYWHIGEASKTARFPKHYPYAQARIAAYVWEVLDVRQPRAEIATLKAVVRAAFNFGWVNVGCLEWFGVERDDPDLTR